MNQQQENGLFSAACCLYLRHNRMLRRTPLTRLVCSSQLGAESCGELTRGCVVSEHDIGREPSPTRGKFTNRVLRQGDLFTNQRRSSVLALRRMAGQ